AAMPGSLRLAWEGRLMNDFQKIGPGEAPGPERDVQPPQVESIAEVRSKENNKNVGSIDDIPEVMSYLNRIGAWPRSMLGAVITEQEGSYSRDIGRVKFTKDGDIKPWGEAEPPTEAEREAIKAAFAEVNWPEINQ